jgi:hypothetical protein
MSTSEQGDFGRRGPQHDDAAPAEPSPLTFIRSPLVKKLAGIGVGIALVLAAIALGNDHMKRKGKALADQWAQNVGYPELDSDASRRHRDASSTYPEIRRACRARADTAGLSRSQNMALEAFEGAMVGENELVRHAAFIDCLMSEMPSRLCQSEHKAHLLDAIRAYYRLRTKVREEWALTAAAPFAGMRVALTNLPGGSHVTTILPSKHTDPRIVAGLTRLIEDGYLSQRDFRGAFLDSSIPRELRNAIKSVERKAQRCGS